MHPLRISTGHSQLGSVKPDQCRIVELNVLCCFGRGRLCFRTDQNSKIQNRDFCKIQGELLCAIVCSFLEKHAL